MPELSRLSRFHIFTKVNNEKLDNFAEHCAGESKRGCFFDFLRVFNFLRAVDERLRQFDRAGKFRQTPSFDDDGNDWRRGAARRRRARRSYELDGRGR